MKKFLRENRFPLLALGSSFGGVAFFYLIPFVLSFGYSVVNNPIQRRFVGGKNYIELFRNPYFLLGLKNTCLFMGAAIPLSILCSLGLALALKSMGRWEGILLVVFLAPLMLPSASAVQFWQGIWARGGARNVAVLIYLWKYLGYYTVLFLTGLYAIPDAYYDCARVFGAGRRQCFRYVTLRFLSPAFLIVLLMSFVNCFKIFREIYLLTGEFPPEEVYLLQHFVNATLLSMHYARLTCAVYVLTALLALAVLALCHRERALSEHYGE